MTRLFNRPADFTAEMVAGFTAANADHVVAVPGGVVRRLRPHHGGVAVVIGGGSGHYPAFGGLVGDGLAAGAAIGNVFASPSARQIHSVAMAADAGGGVLLSYGNYAGDVLNFDAAQEQLIAAGIDCRTVVVTDDVSSAPRDQRAKRRGVAGDLAVFKVAGAAAAAGYSIDDVERVARLANDRTRTFGVAFSGCTLPGADAPLFTVPTGRMALGLGIHGEPGLGEVDMPSADELAQLLLDQLAVELPDGVASHGQRVAVILNGLGSVKYEELFVVFGRLASLIRGKGIELVEPEVGEFCTSFDMAGVSLTLFWLDDELESLWRAPADSPAYRKIARGALGEPVHAAPSEAETGAFESQIPLSSEASRDAAQVAHVALQALAAAMDVHSEELGRIDAVAGDGDHGIGMQRGSQAAAEAASRAMESGAGLRTLLELAGDAWADIGGGTSGMLWGLILRSVGSALSDTGAPSAIDVATGVSRAADAVVAIGKASLGDKTMVDALIPFRNRLLRGTESGENLSAAWAAATLVAEDAATATADLIPRIGRARPHGENSRGTPDAGAASLAIAAREISAVISSGDLGGDSWNL